MSIKKTLLVLLASAFAVSVAFASGTKEAAASAATKAPDKLACIGVIHPYFFPMKNAVEDFSKATGISAIYQATKDFDMEEENTIIDGLTAQGYNGFALWPGHPYSVNVTIAALKKRGIPVILVGGLIVFLAVMVAAVFLPLGFLTGLLGVNVGGIPGSNYPYGFELVSSLLFLLVALQVWIFKRQRWF